MSVTCTSKPSNLYQTNPEVDNLKTLDKYNKKQVCEGHGD